MTCSTRCPQPHLQPACAKSRDGKPSAAAWAGAAARRHLAAAGLAALLAVGPQLALATPVQSLLPGAEQRGTATFRLLGFPVYQARLFTKGAAPLDWSQDFALQLTYQRRLSQADLVEATLREMQRLGHPVPPRATVAACFQGVGPGDSYLAVSQGPDRLKFLLNGSPACTLAAPGIKRHFMSIFLGENTRSARFTRSLMGR